jgi:hypothetical protein
MIAHPGIVTPEPPPAEPPTVDSVNPATTVINTPVQVTISGTGFTADSLVKLDGNGVVTHYVSATELTADMPGFALPGAKDLTVETDGQASAAKTFTVTAT